MRKNRSRGFTLIEMLVSVVIISFLGLVIYNALSQGIRLWRYSLHDRPEWKIDLFMEKLALDLRNGLKVVPGTFTGTRESFQFFTSVPATVESEGENYSLSVPARVRYYYDAEAKAVKREELPYQMVLYSEGYEKTDRGRPVLDKIANFEIEYYYLDAKEKQYHWIQNWGNDCLPRAVKVNIDYQGEKVEKMTRNITLPASEICTGEK